MAKLHPILAALEARGEGRQWLLDRIRKQRSSLAKSQLSRIVNGKQGVNPEQAVAICRALDGAIEPEDLFIWRLPSTRKAKKAA